MLLLIYLPCCWIWRGHFVVGPQPWGRCRTRRSVVIQWMGSLAKSGSIGWRRRPLIIAFGWNRSHGTSDYWYHLSCVFFANCWADRRWWFLRFGFDLHWKGDGRWCCRWAADWLTFDCTFLCKTMKLRFSSLQQLQDIGLVSGCLIQILWDIYKVEGVYL